MPELPDVEAYRRESRGAGKKQQIRNVEVKDQRILTGVRAKQFQKQLKNKRTQALTRHGKYLFLEFDKPPHIAMHFGMTGFLENVQNGSKLPRHTKIVFGLSDNKKIIYGSKRMLGKVAFIRDTSRFVRKKHLGEDALHVPLKKFREAIGASRSSVKKAIMNQSRLAGVGNIYSDEILFQAKIDPRRPVSKLKEGEIRKIHQKMQQVLEDAIRANADPEKMPARFLLPHRKASEKCPNCGGKVRRIKVSGRRCYFCPECQK